MPTVQTQSDSDQAPTPRRVRHQATPRRQKRPSTEVLTALILAAATILGPIAAVVVAALIG